MKRYLLVPATLIIILTACQDNEETKIQKSVTVQSAAATVVEFQGCITCHSSTRNDPSHDFSCIDCHKGNEEGREQDSAHAGLIARPAHPDFMEEICSSCHPEKVKNCQNSLHYTLHNKVNRIREHFDATVELASLAELSPSSRPATKQELVDDLLRRRCLRCHLYSSGDTYEYTQRGTGCAACHMGFSNGELLSHEMIGQPGDFQCLSCHYANFVGADYYGRYEHDFGREFRTPFTTRQDYFRPYGVEYHELVPDIHQQRGLACIDCHDVHNSQGKEKQPISCSSCHRSGKKILAADNLPPNLQIRDNKVLLIAHLTGKEHLVPQLIHPAHDQYDDKISCEVCHAQWSFNDTTTHLLRSDTDEYDIWSDQLIQSSSAVENLLMHNLTSFEDELPPAMKDTVTGKMVPGVWYKGFTERRWERMIIEQDRDGVIKVFRPILDLHLSYVDTDYNVIFDNVQGTGRTRLPYVPHTTGKAGAFYLERFSHLLTPSSSEKAVK